MRTTLNRPVKLESPVHGVIYVDPTQVAVVRNYHTGVQGFPDKTLVYMQNSNNFFDVLGTVHEVMGKLGLEHE